MSDPAVNERPIGEAGGEVRRAASMGSLRLVLSHLGPWVPALLLLKRLAYVDHFYLLTAAVDRLRFPRVRSDLRFAPAEERDLEEALEAASALDGSARRDVVTRVLFFRRGFSGCHVGRNGKNELVSMQWLVRPRDNPLLRKHFRRVYAPLAEDQVMIENVFIFPRHRGFGVLAAATHHLTQLAREEGFRTCLAYIRKDNLTSLNGFLGLGFQLRKLLTSYSLGGITWRAP